MKNKQATSESKFFFDSAKNIRGVIHCLYGCCAVLLLLEFFIHRHSVHSWEQLWGFYPLYGFVACVALVFAAKWLRTWLMRPEDYYQAGSKLETAKDDNKPGADNVDA